MFQKVVLTVALLVAMFFAAVNRAEPTADDSPPPMIRRPNNESSLTARYVPVRYVPSQNRSTRIQGIWRLHPAIKHSAETAKCELDINPDGTARYTGLIPFVIEEEKTDDSEAIPGIGSTRVEIKQSTIRGQWDLNDQYFSIVTSDPSIHRFHVLAITADTLVVEPDLGFGHSGKMFWVRSSSEQ
jgi:hypothetical protein